MTDTTTTTISTTVATSQTWRRLARRLDELDALQAATESSPDDTATDRWSDQLNEVLKEIVALRARTIPGMIVKARAVRACYSPEPISLPHGTLDELLCESLLADLLALEPGEPA